MAFPVARKLRRRRVLGAALAGALAVATAACADKDADAGAGGVYYKGKTIELIVPSAAGTGNDTSARLLAPLLSKYIPGNPHVQVINMEGAGSLTAGNEFAKRKADGLSLFLSGEANTSAYLLGTDGVKYDYKKFEPVLGIPLGSVVVMRPGAGSVNNRDQLLNANKTLILGGEQNSGTTTRALLLDLLGVKYKLVTGYGGNRGEIALQQGEIDISGASTSGYLQNSAPLVAQGKLLALFSLGYKDDSGKFVKDPAVPDIPTVADVYSTLHAGQAPSGEKWDAFNLVFEATRSLTQVLWTSGGVPAGAKEALNEGVEAMKKDPDFAAGVDKVLGGYDPISGDALHKRVDVMTNPNAGTLQWLKDYSAKLYK
ncbi:hypothetical protein KZZ52_36730 [Dactylosporangium sp. AC04546]|uniref:hypothetical protein n=1 Tax=Dactylosporangium sp. AC04546 TaxID=2862460 RepID=UPI002E7B9882|nr:hypothetical protein [Dactylosporangium sp. AC04546]WVK79511.1 hypothetical protein KZZ52_36730 [Dactylosporangium sp. AC04546]